MFSLANVALLMSMIGVVAAGSACGDGIPARIRAGDGADEQGTTRPDEQFIDELARAMCGWQFRCCGLPEIEAVGQSSYLTVEECVPAVWAALSERLSELKFGLLNHQLSLDAALAAACVQRFTGDGCADGAPARAGDRIESATGESPWARLDGCPNPFVGALGSGELCLLPATCQPGNSCRHAGDGAASTELAGVSAGGLRQRARLGESLSAMRGHCQVDQESGEKCARTSECAPGLYCRGTDFVCAAPAGEGEECETTLDLHGAVVAGVVVCAESPRQLLCASGRCRHLPRDGEPCLPATLALPLCDPAPELALSCVGQSFNGTGICKRATAPGATCSSATGLPPCAAPYACISAVADQPIGTCGPAPAAGASCSLDQRCAPPAVCHAASRICVVPPPVRAGSACASDLQCASLNCVASSDPFSGLTSGSCVTVTDPPLCTGPGLFVGRGTNPPVIATGAVVRIPPP